MWGRLEAWHKIGLAVLFFVGLGFGVRGTFVMASDFKQYVGQQEYRWLMVDRKDIREQMREIEIDYGLDPSTYPELKRERYLELKDELEILKEDMDSLRKEK